MLVKNNFFTFEGAPPCSDVDVDAYFSKTEFSEANLGTYLSDLGISYSDLIFYTCTYITGLKTLGVYNSFSLLNLPIGNSATQRKFNFINPLDTDAAFRSTFGGSLTFSSFGIAGASNGFIDTKFTPSVETNINNFGCFYYNRSTPSGTGTHGASDSVFNQIRQAGAFNGSIFGSTGTVIGYGGSFSRNVFLRSYSSGYQLYANNVSVGTYTGGGRALSSSKFYFMARNNSNVSTFDSTLDQISMFGILSQSVSNSDALAIIALNNTYLTNLGLAV
jgi:hypothetical protein